jgi:hypothetical protein
MQGTLKYYTGDALQPVQGGMIMCPHIVNSLGKWGSGFVVNISRRWAKPEQEYKNWFRSQINWKLGEIQMVSTQSEFCIVNMLAQEGIGLDKDGNIPLRYQALSSCMDKVAKAALDQNAIICAPKFGSGLAGGNWSQIETMIIDKWVNKGLKVNIYTLP